MNLLKRLFRKKSKQVPTNKFGVWVTLDWAGDPITTKGDGYILPRKAEMIINKKYYPSGTPGEWPCDPQTGERLPIKPFKPC